jgi:sulfite reductase (ferredoxin)
MATELETTQVWQTPPSVPEDLAAFERNVSEFKAGTISPTQFQVFRVPQGVYEQRESGTYMLRVRLPAGVVTPPQLRQLAAVARQFGDGVLHVTTRQDIQIHRVPVESIHAALVALAKVGLSTKGGGGNTVRNITGCANAGVCRNEAFDVTPHVIALTESLLPDPRSFQLPRKFKVAFSGCERDCAGATINDVGLVAKVRDGREGFALHVAGGLGASSRVADLLEEFVPAEQVPVAVEALKRVFDVHGNRKDRRKARLRFLVREIGLERLRELYREQREAVARERGAPVLRSLPIPTIAEQSGTGVSPADGFEPWRAAAVRPQRQPGFNRVEIGLRLGDIPADRLEALADVVARHGERMLRGTQQQNLVLRWVPDAKLPALHRELQNLGLAAPLPAVLKRLVACTGAATCKLGLCLSRGLADAVANRLERHLDDLAAVGDLKLNISGCPNSCGRHPIADIGLHGAVRRVDGRPVPHYTIQLGGYVEEGRTQLATTVGTIPARNVPGFVAALVAAYRGSGLAPDFRAFVSASAALIARLVQEHQSVPGFTEDRNYYFDWSATELFSLAGRGPGECGAGVLDLIEADLRSATDAHEQRRWYETASFAARALLVVRGEQATTDTESFALFRKHFLETGLADSRFASLVEAGLAAAGQSDRERVFGDRAGEVSALLEHVRELYRSMDGQLQFPKRSNVAATPPATPATPAPEAPADATKDFRGVVCPLNYVKTSMALRPLKSGQTLAVLLDRQGARNVPESAAKDGHEVLSVTPEGDHFRVLIRKHG